MNEFYILVIILLPPFIGAVFVVDGIRSAIDDAAEKIAKAIREARS